MSIISGNCCVVHFGFPCFRVLILLLRQLTWKWLTTQKSNPWHPGCLTRVPDIMCSILNTLMKATTQRVQVDSAFQISFLFDDTTHSISFVSLSILSVKKHFLNVLIVNINGTLNYCNILHFCYHYLLIHDAY